MPTRVSDLIREHALASIGCVERKAQPSLDEMREMKWVPEFEELMRNRLIMGGFRYSMDDLRRRPTKYYDNVRSMQQRLAHYLETGDIETLVDVANLCMLEYRYSLHPRRHMGHGGDHNMHAEETT